MLGMRVGTVLSSAKSSRLNHCVALPIHGRHIQSLPEMLITFRLEPVAGGTLLQFRAESVH